jgi:hypothetical protein
MRKKGLYFIVVMALFSWAWVSSFSDEEKSRIDNEEFENPKRVACVYDHDGHQDASEVVECNVCHHLYEDGKKVEDETSEGESCAECHELNSSEETLPLRKAYHTRCKGCHMTEKAGPVLCGECHQR